MVNPSSDGCHRSHRWVCWDSRSGQGHTDFLHLCGSVAQRWRHRQRLGGWPVLAGGWEKPFARLAWQQHTIPPQVGGF